MENNLNLEKNRPEKTFRASPVSATIWANEATSKDGEIGIYRTITIERTYNKDGKFQKTNSLRVNDLPKAALVLQKAYEYISLKEDEESIEEI